MFNNVFFENGAVYGIMWINMVEPGRPQVIWRMRIACCIPLSVSHTLDAGLLARSQYPEGPATGHFGTGFSWFTCV